MKLRFIKVLFSFYLESSQWETIFFNSRSENGKVCSEGLTVSVPMAKSKIFIESAKFFRWRRRGIRNCTTSQKKDQIFKSKPVRIFVFFPLLVLRCVGELWKRRKRATTSFSPPPFSFYSLPRVWNVMFSIRELFFTFELLFTLLSKLGAACVLEWLEKKRKILLNAV